MIGGEVGADDGHNTHLGEVTGGEGEVSRGASEDVGYSAGRRGDRVKGYGTYYEDAHWTPGSHSVVRILFGSTDQYSAVWIIFCYRGRD